MPVQVNGKHYYRTAEACHIAGISKNTFLRWVREGVVPDVERRDRRGWRIFSTADMNALVKEAHRIST